MPPTREPARMMGFKKSQGAGRVNFSNQESINDDLQGESLASVQERMEASALRILALRSHTRAELGRKLKGRKFPGTEIEALLLRYEEIGYLDDEAAARSWVQRRLRARPMGLRSMARELSGIGVSPEIAELALAEGYGEGGELVSARRAAHKRLKALRGKDKLRERLLRFLQGRGFPVVICIEAADEIVRPEAIEVLNGIDSAPDDV